MIVENPTQDALSNTMIGNMATQIEQAADMINKYHDMLEKAQATVNQLNQVNKVLSGTQDFLNGSILNIANPKDLIDNAVNITKQIKANALALAEQVKNYKIANALRVRAIVAKCPEINYENLHPLAKKLIFNQKGKESEGLKALKSLSSAIGNNMIENGSYIFGQMSGKALAQYICMKRDKQQEIKNIQRADMQARLALLNKDYKRYRIAVATKQASQEKLFRDVQAEVEKLSEPLTNRAQMQMSTLGVSDLKYKGRFCVAKTSSDGVEFCEPISFDIERLNKDFLDFQNDLATKLKSAPDKQQQAQVYANMKQKFDGLSLEFIKDIANNLNFMNSTLSAMAEVMSNIYQKENSVENIDFTKTESKELLLLQKSINSVHKANLTRYGFPASFGSNPAIRNLRSWMDQNNFDYNYKLE
ncbi:hypothetical protein ACFOPX_08255 [Helicobacter baculiformis]|uniref:Uncharacterized protein n=1 Tax=Helicobacter baculiformis TaxID=427351 RepID=A0ABV7ZIX7_9HELI|nr:hypothetical protein [Helicobacter baculiformis]